MSVPAWRRYLRFWREDVNGDVDDELGFHLDMSQRDGVARGLTPDEARTDAARKFGDVVRTRDECRKIGHSRERSVKLADYLGSIRGDAVFAIRQLFRNPAFTITAVLTLALGIGVNGFIFSLVDAVLLRPLGGVSAPDRLVSLGADLSLSYPDYLDLREVDPALSGLAAFSDRTTAVAVAGATQVANVGVVTGNYFSVLGVTPLRGRLLGLGDDTPQAAPVAVLSAGFARRFFPDEDPVGRSIDLNGVPVVVAGVASPEFHGTELDSPDALWITANTWIALAPTAFVGRTLQRRGWSWLSVVGRLRPGAQLGSVKAPLVAAAARHELAYPDEDRGLKKQFLDADVTRAGDASFSNFSHHTLVRSAVIILAVVAMVLLVACANVANLLLARATARQTEIGVRLAIGARRARLVRQLLTEAAILAIIGAALGLVVAALAATAVSRVTFANGFSFGDAGLHLTGGVYAYATALGVITTALFGLVPAMSATAGGIVGAIRTGAPTTSSPRRTAQRMILVAQVALSLVLVIAAGLFVRSMRRALETNPGFDGSHVATATINIGLVRSDSARGDAIYNLVRSRLDHTPGVRVAGWGKTLPLTGGEDADGFTIDNYVPASDEKMEVADNAISPGYLRAFSIPLLRGRFFTDDDRATSPHVVIINRTMAQRYWPNTNPVGLHVYFGNDTTTIVGVVGDVKYHSLVERPQPYVYRLLGQTSADMGLNRQNLVVRTVGDPAAILGVMRRTLHDIAPEVPVYEMSTPDDRADRAVGTQRLGAFVLGLFSLLALAITVVGIYGLSGYGVTQRTREIGVRIALGARAPSVVKLVLNETVVTIALGIGVGLVVSVAATRTVRSFLFGVSAMDLVTFVGASAILLATGILAALIPALRATRVDPVVALRTE
ncbi:MAG: ABC transporter permease [Gemmatimonadaceae bacterium]